MIVENFRTIIVDLVPTLDTSAYAAGDVLFDRTVLDIGNYANPGQSAVQKIRGRILSIGVLDKDDQGIAMDLYFLKADVSLGTVNAAPSITDANAENIIGFVTATASKDLGGCRFGQADCDIRFSIVGETLYLAGVTQGTPTHTAAGLKFRIVLELEEGW
ncbi:hypothetical protein TSACC_3697 [Terrimicrobium sacchariphilum]|uniref:Uncharacterized protein n=1 Tax=Terrimicrobium sacchariphilum TaxID=690879 RepID=A0A146G7G8_TERSA|nr:hypothetical protein [Terrimicrobium sacchariphilum]GAT33302.1 hypothetical protein TSACC_21715 [Terrimicrobium sacchariphilum]GAT35626.1 hypothetical protein TSACC_3697 [Terrimicrobium sacchariphilum]